MDHIVITNLRYNKVNDVVGNPLKFDINSSLNIPIRDTQPLVTISLIGGKEYRKTVTDGLKCMWYNRASKSMLKRETIDPYTDKLRTNKVEYITAAYM